MTPALPPPETLIACPRCDALHRMSEVSEREEARCIRCHTRLIEPFALSFLHLIALSFTAMILMVGAIFFPFLKVSAAGLSHGASIFAAAMAFSDGILAPLSVAVLLMIVALPSIRFVALIYALWPLSLGRSPYAHATRAFRLAETLQPWSMAEIFTIGTAVALVKVAGLAAISFGPAFWAFSALIIITALKNAFMSKSAIWRALGAA